MATIVAFTTRVQASRKPEPQPPKPEWPEEYRVLAMFAIVLVLYTAAWFIIPWLDIRG